MPETVRVKLHLNGTAKEVLRAGTGTRPPTLLFQFMDSAEQLEASPFAAH